MGMEEVDVKEMDEKVSDTSKEVGGESKRVELVRGMEGVSGKVIGRGM